MSYETVLTHVNIWLVQTMRGLWSPLSLTWITVWDQIQLPSCLWRRINRMQERSFSDWVTTYWKKEEEKEGVNYFQVTRIFFFFFFFFFS